MGRGSARIESLAARDLPCGRTMKKKKITGGMHCAVWRLILNPIIAYIAPSYCILGMESLLLKF